MQIKKTPLFKDMVRIASAIRSENGKFLKDASGQTIPAVQEQFKKFSFLKVDTVKNVVNRYLNNIDRGI